MFTLPALGQQGKTIQELNMATRKIEAGSFFPRMLVKKVGGGEAELGRPSDAGGWQMVVVYRGWHCPLCTKYLNALEGYRQRLLDNGVDLIAVSADSKAQVEKHRENLEVNFVFAYGLTIGQMQELGLYISHPRSAEETDHPFPEPGLFVINDKGEVQIVDLSNNPFVRPELESLVSGLAWLKDPANNYPIRGTYQ